jgi:hypothetical protein
MSPADFREQTRGGQCYLLPLVGKGWTDTERRALVDDFRARGYFVRVISPGRIAITELST